MAAIAEYAPTLVRGREPKARGHLHLAGDVLRPALGHVRARPHASSASRRKRPPVEEPEPASGAGDLEALLARSRALKDRLPKGSAEANAARQLVIDLNTELGAESHDAARVRASPN